MGKSALLYVAAASLMLVGLYGDSSRSGLATTKTEAQYYERVLSREIAQSAFNVLLARARADFAGHRPNLVDVPYRDGAFSYSATGAASGPVWLEAVGEVGASIHRISGILVSDAEARFAALTIDGPVEYIDPRGSAWIASGVDTEPPGSSSTEGRVSGPGVRSVLESADVIARAAMPASQVIGSVGEGHFVQGAGPVDFALLARDIEAHEDLVVLEGSQRWKGNTQFGTPEAPIIMMVNGNLTITGNTVGYGALLVRGSIVTSAGTPRWEGLVIVQAQGGEHGILGNTRFFGALALQSVTADGETGGEEDAGMLGGHFDVTVAGGPTNELLYQAHQYDDRFDVTGIDLMRPGCGEEGGLCWEEKVAASSQVTLTVLNGSSTSGRIYLETANSSIDTSITAGFSRTVELSSLRALRFTFDGVCSLPGAAPATVEDNASNRAGAFTVRMTDAATGSALIDVSVYHHLAGSACARRGNVGVSPFVEVQPMVLDMRGNPGIYASATALRRLGTVLPQASPGQPTLLLREIRETGDRIAQ